jgi:hypothetical protein
VVGTALRRALLPFGFVAGARPAKVRGVGVGGRRTGTRRERTWTGRDGKWLLRHRLQVANGGRLCYCICTAVRGESCPKAIYSYFSG